jgi:hypothetical protein
MLYHIKYVYDDGRATDEIIHSDKPLVIYPKRDGIKTSKSSIHKYEIESTLPPTIYKSSQDNKVYLVPMWIEVHPQTTYDDVVWIRPKAKKIIEHIQGSMGEYKTTYNPNKNTYHCSCMGFWRSKGNCKHVKALKEKNLVNQTK